MSNSQAKIRRIPPHIATGALLLLWLAGPAVAQVGPVPPMPPTAAPTAAQKTDTQAGQPQADDAKAAPAKVEEKKKPDTLGQWIEKVRSWSLPGFLAWLRDHGFNIVLILVLASVILWLANRFHKRLVIF